MKCSTCKLLVNKKYITNHYKNKLHKNNVLKSKHSLTNVTILDSAFENGVVTYEITLNVNKSNDVLETPELLFDSIANTIMILTDESIKDLTIFKLNFVLHADFIQQTKQIIRFHSKPQIML